MPLARSGVGFGPNSIVLRMVGQRPAAPTLTLAQSLWQAGAGVSRARASRRPSLPYITASGLEFIYGQFSQLWPLFKRTLKP